MIETYDTKSKQTAVQMYKVRDKYYGRSLLWLLNNVYRERVTEMEPYKTSIPIEFTQSQDKFIFCDDRGLYINIFDFRDYGSTFKRFQCGLKGVSLGFDFVPTQE